MYRRLGTFGLAVGKAYERGYKMHIVVGSGRVKVHTLSFSVIKPKITNVNQLSL